MNARVAHTSLASDARLADPMLLAATSTVPRPINIAKTLNQIPVDMTEVRMILSWSLHLVTGACLQQLREESSLALCLWDKSAPPFGPLLHSI